LNELPAAALLSTNGIDAAVLGTKGGDIGLIEGPEKNPKLLMMPTIAELCRMPDLENLMPIWPEDMNCAFASNNRYELIARLCILTKDIVARLNFSRRIPLFNLLRKTLLVIVYYNKYNVAICKSSSCCSRSGRRENLRAQLLVLFRAFLACLLLSAQSTLLAQRTYSKSIYMTK
jgi:hypothetical protein